MMDGGERESERETFRVVDSNCVQFVLNLIRMTWDRWIIQHTELKHKTKMEPNLKRNKSSLMLASSKEISFFFFICIIYAFCSSNPSQMLALIKTHLFAQMKSIFLHQLKYNHYKTRSNKTSWWVCEPLMRIEAVDCISFQSRTWYRWAKTPCSTQPLWSSVYVK